MSEKIYELVQRLRLLSDQLNERYDFLERHPNIMAGVKDKSRLMRIVWVITMCKRLHKKYWPK